MGGQTAANLSRKAQIAFSAGSAAFTMLERLILLYVPFFFLPPREYHISNLIPEEAFLGLVTLLGSALALGRIVDAVSNPLVATWSDNCRLPVGRRKLFLLGSSLPLALITVMVFMPPLAGEEHFLNGVWLAVMMCLFYFIFALYVNPYLALISELGHTDAIRINLSTLVALSGMVGMVIITVLFPEIVSRLQHAGMGIRQSYQAGVLGAAIPSAALLFLAAFSFREQRHCRPVNSRQAALREALVQALKIPPFRRFVSGEVFMQFAMNLVTVGMMYFTVVIFQEEERFMTVLAALLLGSALLAFPKMNAAAKKRGKAKILTYSSLTLALCGLAIFLMSFNMTGIFFYLSLAVFTLAGVPAAAFSILVNPTIAEIARSEAAKTGERREGIFFAARAVPIKITIALAGGIFGFLLSTFGRDVSDPLGVQLTILLIALSSLAGFFIFRRYPEEEVQAPLQEEEQVFKKSK